jgi:type VI secretion system secreted protein VgrG
MSPTAANVQRFSFSPRFLPDGELEVVSFVGHEAVSQPFRFELELVSTNPSVPFSDLVDQPATLGMTWDGGELPVHGVVAHFEQGGPVGDDYYGYRAVLVPRLWRLSLTHQSRIFQALSVPDIIRQVLTETGFAPDDFEFQLSGSYAPREYCTQYQETDLAFVSRLLEHEGICYFFKHEEKREVLVFTDDRSHLPAIEGNDSVAYHAMGGRAQPHEETIQAFVFREQIVTGKVILKDYNYQTPEADLSAESQISDELPGVYYEYGSNYKDAGEGSRLARIRNEEIECRRRVGVGEGTCLRLRAGHVFTLNAHYRLDLNHGYLITEVTHYGSQRGAMSMQVRGEEEPIPYRNEFTSIPSTVQYRPPRLIPEPRLPGVMTAKVDTAGGEYAHLDDQGRYRARMDFDRSGTGEGNATLPIPMKQAYSGPDYGIHFPNHAETDMIWACLNGDPDRPFALGTAPNPTQASPSTIANNHQNVIRTWGQNELTFDDKQGEENIFLFATKDHTVEVTNDESVTVGNDQLVTIGNDQTEHVGSNQELTVGVNRDKSVGANQSETVGANKSITVGGSHSESISGSMTQNVGVSKSENVAAAKSLAVGGTYQVSVGATMDETVGGAKTEQVGAYKGESVGGSKSESVGGSKSVTIGESLSVNVGDSQSLEVAKTLDVRIGEDHHEQVAKEWAVNAKKIQLMAEDQITLKTGKAEIIMKKSGDIIIKGKKIQVKGSGDVVIKGSNIKQN